jgi:nicotinate-nucleotide pyrophosphorylase (carboxylating)
MMRTPDQDEIDRVIAAGLREDAARRDVTGRAIFGPAARARAVLRAKEAGVLAGLPVARRVFSRLDPAIRFVARRRDGDRVAAGEIVAEIRGPTRALLAGERLALNLLQRMSGIATLTARYVEAVRGLPVRILDTRKTAPGLRALDKYAVACGGAANHRMSLADLAMIKDNHLRAAGSIQAAVEKVRRAAPRVKIEVEASTLDEVQEAAAARVDFIMLDNMAPDLMREAVALVAGRAKIEASGSISMENVRAVAETGVDFISVGRLTHSAPALDLSMKFV